MPKQIVRVVCDVEGYEEFWIEYDVSGWGLDVFTSLPFTPFPQVVRNFIPEHSVNWHIVADDGAVVPHPGPGHTDILWDSIWKQIGPETGKAIYRWLALSSIMAMGQASTPSKKRPGGDQGTRGDEEGDAAD